MCFSPCCKDHVLVELTLCLPPDIMKKSSGLLVCCSACAVHKEHPQADIHIHLKYFLKICQNMKPSSWTNVRRSICEENRDDFAQNQRVGHHWVSTSLLFLCLNHHPPAGGKCCEDTFHCVNSKARFQADVLLIQGVLLHKSSCLIFIWCKCRIKWLLEIR